MKHKMYKCSRCRKRVPWTYSNPIVNGGFCWDCYKSWTDSLPPDPNQLDLFKEAS